MVQDTAEFRAEVEQLARQVRRLQETHTGLLVRVIVSCPPGYSLGRILDHLEGALQDSGTEAVRVDCEASPGPLRVLSCEFQR